MVTSLTADSVYNYTPKIKLSLQNNDNTASKLNLFSLNEKTNDDNALEYDYIGKGSVLYPDEENFSYLDKVNDYLRALLNLKANMNFLSGKKSKSTEKTHVVGQTVDIKNENLQTTKTKHVKTEPQADQASTSTKNNNCSSCTPSGCKTVVSAPGAVWDAAFDCIGKSNFSDMNKDEKKRYYEYVKSNGGVVKPNPNYKP